MIWVSWRRQRAETVIAAAALALVAVLLVPTGIQMADQYHHDGLAACLGPNGASDSCGQAINALTSRFQSLNSFIDWLTLVPGLIGVLLAAPFVLEFEQGTYRLAWTQSVPRGRWIVTKLGVAIAAAVLGALVLTLLLTWWRAPLVHFQGRMQQGAFDSEGTVVFGYTLFALGLAAAIGALWRRGIPAVALGFVGYFATRIFFDTWLRQRLLSPLKTTWPLMGPEPVKLFRAWVLNEHPVDRFGHTTIIPPGVCGPSRVLTSKPVMGDCLAKHGYVMQSVYEPASRFWELQAIETALFGGVAILLLAFAAWWTYRRVA